MRTPSRLTAAQRRALEILREHGPLRPREFARLMWPDSLGWRHSVKCGAYGSHRGGGMYRLGGGYLGKLHKLGLTYWTHRTRYDTAHAISSEGLTALDTAHLVN